MKSYSEFMEYIKENVTDYLPERFEEAEISIQQVVKNNDVVLDGLLISSLDSHISPTIYLNPLYEQYKEEKDLDGIVSNIADTYIENIEPVVNRGFQEKLEEIGNYETVKDYIFPKLVNLEKNSIRLQDAPYTQREDLAVTYNIKVTGDSHSMGSIMITNYLMEKYGVTPEELHVLAMENMERLSPSVCEPLENVMVEVSASQLSEQEGISFEEAKEHVREMLPPGGTEIYCLSNESKLNGAVSIISENVQKMVAEQVGGDYYVLPSSVHELMIVPKSLGMNLGELEEMVSSVNAACVRDDEVLSNHVYQYDAKEHKFSRCVPERNLKKNLELDLEPAVDVQWQPGRHNDPDEQPGYHTDPWLRPYPQRIRHRPVLICAEGK